MAMTDNRWDKFKNTEVTHKGKKYQAIYKLVHDKISRLNKKQEADSTPEPPQTDTEDDNEEMMNDGEEQVPSDDLR